MNSPAKFSNLNSPKFRSYCAEEKLQSSGESERRKLSSFSSWVEYMWKFILAGLTFKLDNLYLQSRWSGGIFSQEKHRTRFAQEKEIREQNKLAGKLEVKQWFSQ